jgi:hypothetical protein
MKWFILFSLSDKFYTLAENKFGRCFWPSFLVRRVQERERVRANEKEEI